MGYKKCPRCELNYIRDDQQLCDVCSRKRKASDDDNEVLMCIESRHEGQGALCRML